MKKSKRTDMIIIIVLAALIVPAVVLRLVGSKGQGSEQVEAKAETYSDFDGKRIGILGGTNMEAESFKFFPNSEYFYFNGYPDLNAALLAGSIDAYLGDEPALRSIHAEQPEIDYLRSRLTNNMYSFAFRKNDAEEKALRDEFNSFLRSIKSNGVYDEIGDIWFGVDEDKKVVDMEDLTGENGVIRVVTTSTDEPFSYIKDGKNVGYDIDVVARFCREKGYALELGDVDFSARIPALASGRYHFTTSMNVTPEREETVLFSEPVSEGGIVVAARASEIANAPEYKDFIGKRVGILTGYSLEQRVLELFPNSSYYYFETMSDMALALVSGNIDCFAEDAPAIRMVSAEDERINYLTKYLVNEDYYLAFGKASAKTAELLPLFNEFLARMGESGELDALQQLWTTGSDAAEAAFDRTPLSGENGELTIALSPDHPPFNYVSNGEYTGYLLDLVTRFARENGYSLKIESGNLASSLAGASSGKYDLVVESLSFTAERAQTLSFTDSVFKGGMTLAYRSLSAGEAGNEGNFFERIRSSFEKNFIREQRWRLILRGIGATCLITLLSAIFGTILAFLICMFRRTGSKLANTISNLFVKLLQGTPTVVLLMILYYIVFAKTRLSALSVAVIGFTLNLGAYASEIMRSGIESIDPGQREAALALGYSENRAFFSFILPQAAQRFLPVYRGELVSLLKSTSIVGYITVQDLTKMSDIIRARTYEAFFPLIATAIIYFLLAWIISLIMSAILRAVEPKKKHKGGNAK